MPRFLYCGVYRPFLKRIYTASHKKLTARAFWAKQYLLWIDRGTSTAPILSKNEALH